MIIKNHFSIYRFIFILISFWP